MVRTKDRHLIGHCLQGDANAFGELIEKYSDSMHALAHRRVGNFHDAQDLTQEAFLIAYQKLQTLKQWDNFSEWMYSIVNNLCSKWWQSQLRRPDIESVEEVDAQILSESPLCLHRETQTYQLLYETLATLPNMYRQVLRLYYLGGYKSREIGESLGLSKNTVDTRLRRAKNLLREQMQQSISCEERETSSGGISAGIILIEKSPLGRVTIGGIITEKTSLGVLGAGTSLTRCPCFFCSYWSSFRQFNSINGQKVKLANDPAPHHFCFADWTFYTIRQIPLWVVMYYR